MLRHGFYFVSMLKLLKFMHLWPGAGGILFSVSFDDIQQNTQKPVNGFQLDLMEDLMQILVSSKRRTF